MSNDYDAMESSREAAYHERQSASRPGCIARPDRRSVSPHMDRRAPAWRTHRDDRVVNLERDANTLHSQSGYRSYNIPTACHSLVLDALLDVDRILLHIRELRGVLDIENELLTRRQCRRVKLEGQHSDLWEA